MDTHPTARRRAVRIAVCLFVLAAAWLIFRLFEPMLVWSTGWQPMPPAPEAAAVEVAEAWRPYAMRADAWLRDAQRDLQAPAISAAIAVDGEQVWAGAIGRADLEAGTPVGLDSRFRLGSTSKAVTSVAIGTLLDGAQIDLDAPVSRYVPDLAAPLATITTRQAMSHTAGVRDYGICLCFPIWEHLNRRHYSHAARDGLRTYESDPLLFAPGTAFQYSSFGYNVAGAVLEAAAGEPFLDHLQHAVFEPLRMDGSGGDLADVDVPPRVAFYEVVDRQYKRAFEVDTSNKWPSGGLISTPSDMVKLGRAMLQPTLFSTATRDRLIAPQPLADGSANPQGYALGWRYFGDKKLFGDRVKTRFFTHHGTAVGSTSYFAVYPEYGLVVSMMMNKGQENVDAMAPHATKLVELFLAERVGMRSP